MMHKNEGGKRSLAGRRASDSRAGVTDNGKTASSRRSADASGTSSRRNSAQSNSVSKADRPKGSTAIGKVALVLSALLVVSAFAGVFMTDDDRSDTGLALPPDNWSDAPDGNVIEIRQVMRMTSADALSGSVTLTPGYVYEIYLAGATGGPSGAGGAATLAGSGSTISAWLNMLSDTEPATFDYLLGTAGAQGAIGGGNTSLPAGGGGAGGAGGAPGGAGGVGSDSSYSAGGGGSSTFAFNGTTLMIAGGGGGGGSGPGGHGGTGGAGSAATPPAAGGTVYLGGNGGASGGYGAGSGGGATGGGQPGSGQAAAGATAGSGPGNGSGGLGGGYTASASGGGGGAGYTGGGGGGATQQGGPNVGGGGGGGSSFISNSLYDHSSAGPNVGLTYVYIIQWAVVEEAEIQVKTPLQEVTVPYNGSPQTVIERNTWIKGLTTGIELAPVMARDYESANHYLNFHYEGTQGPSAIPYSSNIAPINSGQYTVTITLKEYNPSDPLSDPVLRRYTWAEPVEVTLIIAPVALEVPELLDDRVPYNKGDPTYPVFDNDFIDYFTAGVVDIEYRTGNFPEDYFAISDDPTYYPLYPDINPYVLLITLADDVYYNYRWVGSDPYGTVELEWYIVESAMITGTVTYFNYDGELDDPDNGSPIEGVHILYRTYNIAKDTWTSWTSLDTTDSDGYYEVIFVSIDDIELVGGTKSGYILTPDPYQVPPLPRTFTGVLPDTEIAGQDFKMSYWDDPSNMVTIRGVVEVNIEDADGNPIYVGLPYVYVEYQVQYIHYPPTLLWEYTDIRGEYSFEVPFGARVEITRVWASGYSEDTIWISDGVEVNKRDPVEIGTDDDWAYVSTGLYHTVAIKTDGTLWAWGSNAYGQLGDDTNINRSVPTRIGTDDDWAYVSAGLYHTVAIKTDGTLWAWGNNEYGQLGDGTEDDSNEPVQIGDDEDWEYVSAGRYHTTAIKDDGTLWSWGSNVYGQLGRAITVVPSHTPGQVGTDTDWAEVSAGSSHTTAIKDDGTLWAWGYNHYGQLGDGTNINRNVPTQIGTDTDWAYVSAGASHTTAIKDDGTLWAWGGNEYGQLGDGTEVNRPAPTQIGMDPDWAYVSAGTYHTMAVKTDGTLWAWGSNVYGQLGDGTEDDSNIPVQVGEDSDWRYVSIGFSAGTYHTVAIKDAGTMWAWGGGGLQGDGATGLVPWGPNQIFNDTIVNFQMVFSTEYYTIGLQVVDDEGNGLEGVIIVYNLRYDFGGSDDDDFDGVPYLFLPDGEGLVILTDEDGWAYITLPTEMGVTPNGEDDLWLWVEVINVIYPINESDFTQYDISVPEGWAPPGEGEDGYALAFGFPDWPDPVGAPWLTQDWNVVWPNFDPRTDTMRELIWEEEWYVLFLELSGDTFDDGISPRFFKMDEDSETPDYGVFHMVPMPLVTFVPQNGFNGQDPWRVFVDYLTHTVDEPDPEPIFHGNTFRGWFTVEDPASPLDDPFHPDRWDFGTEIYDSMTLYAGWERIGGEWIVEVNAKNTTWEFEEPPEYAAVKTGEALIMEFKANLGYTLPELIEVTMDPKAGGLYPGGGPKVTLVEGVDYTWERTELNPALPGVSLIYGTLTIKKPPGVSGDIFITMIAEPTNLFLSLFGVRVGDDGPGGGRIIAMIDGVEISPVNTMVNHGTIIEFTAFPNLAWNVKAWYVDAAPQEDSTGKLITSDTLVFTMPGENKRIEVEFERLRFTMHFGVMDNEGGSISLNIVGESTYTTSPVYPVYYGDLTRFISDPAPGYRVKEWYVNGALIDSRSPVQSYSVTGDMTVTVVYELDPNQWFRISGYVTNAEGVGLPGVAIHYTLTPPGETVPIPHEPELTDSDGRYTILVQAGMTIDIVRVWASGYSEDAVWFVNGTEVNKNAPVQVGTDSDWAYVSAGMYHTVAIKDDGTLWAWGSNEHGQLGIGKTILTITGTVEDSLGAALGGASIQYEINGDTSVTLSTAATGSDGVYTIEVGYGDSVEITGVTRAGYDLTPSSQVPVDLGTITASTAGPDFEMSNGRTIYTVYGFVEDVRGAPLAGATVQYQINEGVNGITYSTAVTDSDGRYIIIVEYHTIVEITGVTKEGYKATADNILPYPLGEIPPIPAAPIFTMEPDISRNVPVRIGTDNNWAEVSAGSVHTVAIKINGELWAWGCNEYGQLGDGTEDDSYEPVQIGTDDDWKSVAAGSDHTTAIKTDGTMWAWGSNEYGQLGDGTEDDSNIPVQLGTDTDWAYVSAGMYHTTAIKTNGELYAWGYNYYGQLGDGTEDDSNEPILIGTGWMYVSAGIYHTTAIKTDGTLWAWGYNYYGQLGDGTGSDSNEPVQIGTDNDWKSVAAGFSSGMYHTVAIKNAGTMWAWGGGGLQGDGTTGLLPWGPNEIFSHMNVNFLLGFSSEYYTVELQVVDENGDGIEGVIIVYNLRYDFGGSDDEDFDGVPYLFLPNGKDLVAITDENGYVYITLPTEMGVTPNGEDDLWVWIEVMNVIYPINESDFTLYRLPVPDGWTPPGEGDDGYVLEYPFPAWPAPAGAPWLTQDWNVVWPNYDPRTDAMRDLIWGDPWGTGTWYEQFLALSGDTSAQGISPRFFKMDESADSPDYGVFHMVPRPFVTFVPQNGFNGQDPWRAFVDQDGFVEIPATNPRWDGNVFKGWFTIENPADFNPTSDPDLPWTNFIWYFGTEITENKTLYAGWFRLIIYWTVEVDADNTTWEFIEPPGYAAVEDTHELVMKFTADLGYTLPASITVMMGTEELVQDVDYTWKRTELDTTNPGVSLIYGTLTIIAQPDGSGGVIGDIFIIIEAEATDIVVTFGKLRQTDGTNIMYAEIRGVKYYVSGENIEIPVNEGESVKFVVIPGDDWRVKTWWQDGIDLVDDLNEYLITVTDSTEVLVEFQRLFHLTVAVSGLRPDTGYGGSLFGVEVFYRIVNPLTGVVLDSGSDFTDFFGEYTITADYGTAIYVDTIRLDGWFNPASAARGPFYDTQTTRYIMTWDGTSFIHMTAIVTDKDTGLPLEGVSIGSISNMDFSFVRYFLTDENGVCELEAPPGRSAMIQSVILAEWRLDPVARIYINTEVDTGVWEEVFYKELGPDPSAIPMLKDALFDEYIIYFTMTRITYDVFVDIEVDGNAWEDSLKTVSLKLGDDTPIPLTETLTETAPFVGSGTFTGNVPSGTYKIFVDGADTGRTFTVTADGDRELLDYWSMLLSAGIGIDSVSMAGSASLPAVSGIFLSGQSIPIEATPGSTYVFHAWVPGDLTPMPSVPDANPATFEMPNNPLRLTALGGYEVTVNITGSGSVDVTVGTDAPRTISSPGETFTVFPGTEVRFLAEATPSFSHWADSKGMTTTNGWYGPVVINEHYETRAFFYKGDGTDGSVTITVNIEFYNSLGSSVSGDNSSVDVLFTDAEDNLITVTVIGVGSHSVVVYRGEYEEYSGISFKANPVPPVPPAPPEPPIPSYIFRDWTVVDGTTNPITDNPYPKSGTVAVEDGMEITAVFVDSDTLFTITSGVLYGDPWPTPAGAPGPGTISPTSPSLAVGSDQLFTFNAGTDWHIVGLIIDGADIDTNADIWGGDAVSGSYLIKDIRSNRSIIVVFDPDPYVRVTVGPNGQVEYSSGIIPGGTISYITAEYDGVLYWTKTFTITPNEYYYLDTVTINGTLYDDPDTWPLTPTLVDGQWTYTFPDVVIGDSMVVTFAIDPEVARAVTVTAGAGGNVDVIRESDGPGALPITVEAGTTKVIAVPKGDTIHLSTSGYDHGYSLIYWAITGTGGTEYSAYPREKIENIQDNMSVEAVFSSSVYKLLVEATAGGDVSWFYFADSPADTIKVFGGLGEFEVVFSIPQGVEIEFTAIEDLDYTFSRWSGTYTSFLNPASLLMSSERLVSGETVKVKAMFISDSDLAILDVTVGTGGKPVTVTIGSDTYTVTVNEAIPLEKGTFVTLNAVADTNYVFSRWVGTMGTESLNTTSQLIEGLEVLEDVTLTAMFIDTSVPGTYYTIDLSVIGPGTVTLTIDGESYTYTNDGTVSTITVPTITVATGTKVAYSAAPIDANVFSRWVGTMGAASLNSTASSVDEYTIGGNITLAAIFIDTTVTDVYTIDLTVTGPGTVTLRIDGDIYHYTAVTTLTVPTITVESGAIVSYSAAPTGTNAFSRWVGTKGTTPVTSLNSTELSHPSSAINGNMTLEAVFIDTSVPGTFYTISLTVAGPGTVTLRIDGESYLYTTDMIRNVPTITVAVGTELGYSAVPATSYAFSRWVGTMGATSLNSTEPSIDPYTLNDNVIIRAIFVSPAASYTIDLSVIGPGTVTLTIAGEIYQYTAVTTLTVPTITIGLGTQVSYSATPTDTNVFSRWVGTMGAASLNSTEPSIAAHAISGNMTLAAMFIDTTATDTYTMDLTVTGPGTVTLTIDGESYRYTAVTTLTVPTITVAVGTEVGYSAAPTGTNAFSRWIGTMGTESLNGTAQTVSPSLITGNMILEAVFINTTTTGIYTIDLTVTGPGTVTLTIDGEIYRYTAVTTLTVPTITIAVGTTLVYSAAPTDANAFSRWVGTMGTESLNGTVPTVSLMAISGDITLEAVFIDTSVPDTFYTIDLMIRGPGTVTLVIDDESYTYTTGAVPAITVASETKISYYATPTGTNVFSRWVGTMGTGSLNSTEPSIDEYFISGNITLRAVFIDTSVPDTFYMIDLTVTGPGTVTLTIDGESYTYPTGTVPTITVASDAMIGYSAAPTGTNVFSRWVGTMGMGSINSTNPSVVAYAISGYTEIEAIFIDTSVSGTFYTIDLTVTGPGTVTLTIDGESYTYPTGTVPTITVASDAMIGYSAAPTGTNVFSRWIGTMGTASLNSTESSIDADTIAGNITLEAVFIDTSVPGTFYMIDLTVTGPGTVTLTIAGQSYTYPTGTVPTITVASGTSVSYSAAPTGANVFSRWIGTMGAASINSTNPSVVAYAISGNVTLEAVFIDRATTGIYTIDLTVTGPGTVTLTIDGESYTYNTGTVPRITVAVGTTLGYSAAPTGTNAFSRWIGTMGAASLNGTVPTVASSAIGGNVTLEAVFIDTSVPGTFYTIDLTVTGSGTVTMTIAGQSYTYSTGTVPTITVASGTPVGYSASPTGANAFSRWVGTMGTASLNGTETSIPVSPVNGNVTLEAIFLSTASGASYIIDLEVTTGGKVTVTIGGKDFVYSEGTYPIRVESGAVVGFKAEATDTGYSFSRWTGSMGALSLNSVESITPGIPPVSGNISLTALFVYGDLTMNIEVNGPGSVTFTVDGTDTYTITSDKTIPVTTGTTFTLVAAAVNFTGWSGDVPSSARTIFVEMEDVNVTVTANFDASGNKTLELTINGIGSVVVNGVTYTSTETLYFATNTTVTLTASATNFVGWSGDISWSAATLVIDRITDPMELTATFNAAGNRTLLLTIDGSGSVEVEGSTEPYTSTVLLYFPISSSVKLTADVSNFIGWSGEFNSNAAEVTVLLDVNREMTAHFGASNAVLTLTIAGTGTGSVTVEGVTYDSDTLLYFLTGATITLSAPALNFIGWSGAVTANTLDIELTMNGDKAVTASFDSVLGNSKLSLTVSGTGSVDVTAGGATNTYTSYTEMYFVNGTSVTLTASTTDFIGWSGTFNWNAAQVTTVMDVDKALTASFSSNAVLTLTIDGTGAQPVVVEGVTYNESIVLYFMVDTTITLSAPALNFIGWSGAVTANTLDIELEMDADKAITATFTAAGNSKLSLDVDGPGSVDVIADGATNTYTTYTELYFATGTVVTLTASTMYFFEWTDTFTGTIVAYSETITVTMSGDAGRMATFDSGAPAVILTLTITGAGSVNVNGVTYSTMVAQALHFRAGTLVTLIADTTDFIGWTGDVVANADRITLDMTTGMAITATFDNTIGNSKLLLTISGTGSVDVVGSTDPCTSTTTLYFLTGTTVTLTANPTNFVGWTGEITSYAATVNVTMNGDKNMTASFDNVLGNRMIDLTFAGTSAGSVNVNGVVYDASDILYFRTGTTVTLTADVLNFGGWSGDITANTLSLTEKLDEDLALTVTFDTAGNYRLLLTISGTGGSVNITGATYPYTSTTTLYFLTGTTVTLTADPTNFVGWSGYKTSQTLAVDVPMDADRNMTASFDTVLGNRTIDLTFAGTSAGSVDVNGIVYDASDVLYFRTGTTVTLKADETKFVGWSGDITANTATLVIENIAESIALTVTFAVSNSKLLLTISGAGSVDVAYGGMTNTYTLTVNLYFPVGTTVPLTAHPTDFVGWSGAMESQALAIAILMNANKDIMAGFDNVRGNKTIDLTITGNGSVTVDGVTYSSNVTLYLVTGALATVDAVPDAGNLFSKWTGVLTGNETPQNLQMSENKTLGAVFLEIGTLITVTGTITDIEGVGIPDIGIYDGETLLATTDENGVYSFTVEVGTNVTITEVFGSRYSLDPEDQVPLDLGSVTYDLDGIDFIVYRSNDIPVYIFLLPMIALLLIALAGYLYWFIAMLYRNALDVFMIHLQDVKIKGKERAHKGKKYKFKIEGAHTENFVMYQVGEEGEWKFLEPSKKGVYTIPKEEVTDHMTLHLK